MLLTSMLLFFALGAPETLAWKRASASEVALHGYRFDKVVAEREGKCIVRLRVSFRSPRKGLVRLRAAVRFESGGEVWTAVKGFRGRGPQTLEYAHDSADARCWGAKPQQPIELVVSACFDKGCQPPPLKQK